MPYAREVVNNAVSSFLISSSWVSEELYQSGDSEGYIGLGVNSNIED
jgi:hypothetical protein